MKLIFAGGGTGGHLLVGLAVAEEVKTKFLDSKILFFVTGKDLEVRCVTKGGFDAIPINVSPWKKSITHIPKFVFGHFKGILRSLRTIRRFNPDLVVGLGGYSSVPPLVAALLLGVPYVILEQNVLPGKANRLMARWAKGVYTHFPECGVRSAECGIIPNSEFRIPHWDGWHGQIHLSVPTSTGTDKQSLSMPPSAFRIPHLQVTGTPIRKGILNTDREEAAKTLKLSPFKKTLLVMGGSQGARSINEVITQCLPELERLSRTLQIVHCTGESDYERVKASYNNIKINAFVCGFLDNMGAAYSIADLVICRAGATTIAEVTAIGIPAIFVPYPYASENHQYWNAQAIAEKGGGIIVEEAELTPQRLLKVIGKLLEDDEKRLKMKNISKSLGKPDAATVIVNLIRHKVECNARKSKKSLLFPLFLTAWARRP